MKSTATLLIAILISILSFSQECDDYLLLQEGKSLEYTNKDKKGKALTVGNHKAISVENNGNEFKSIIELDLKNLDKGDTFKMEYNVSCNEGIISIDMSRFFDSSQLMQYEGADFNIDVEGDMLYFPRNLKEGESLNDGNLTIKVNKDGFTFVTMTMRIFNRQVLGKETISTKAGTFDCYKVSFDFESKFGIIKAIGSAEEWYHDNRILVLSKSFSKKGKLQGSTELTKLLM